MSVIKNIKIKIKKWIKMFLKQVGLFEKLRKIFCESSNPDISKQEQEFCKIICESSNPDISKQEQELQEMRIWLEGFDRNHVWAFNSGNYGQDFCGNPKYLFVYINYYRPDIRAYWICRSNEVLNKVESLGFRGLYVGTLAAEYASTRTGVVVNEQVRGFIPFPDNVKYLNLWHGHGYKNCERARIEDSSSMRVELAKKYIKNNSYYRNNMIVCCVNSIQEKNFLNYMGVPERNMLHAGYARCTYQQRYKEVSTFEHNILAHKGLSEKTRVAVYAPTFRADQTKETFQEAIVDLERLYDCCEEQNILFIFKMHPLMEQENGYLLAKSLYGEKQHFLFWDNQNDIYEIINKIDLLIYDYSSIFNDFLLGGVKHFIRYIYDSDNMVNAASINNEEEYYANTLGPICKTFDEMLLALAEYEKETDKEKVSNLLNQAWEYSDENDFENTIEFAMNFEIGDEKQPVLYSFDIFDTLFSREGLLPESIFFRVKENMQKSGWFSTDFVNMFPSVRKAAEANVRAYMNKSQEQRESFRTEITLMQIYGRIRDVYGLSQDLVEKLMQWEIDAELDSVVPLSNQIQQVKELLAEDETVILISDMYLPKDVISRMLEKADPVLAQLPFFLSNEYGVLKSNGLLFFEVYRSFKPFYNFSKWIHAGDNIKSDQNQPRKLNINTRLIERPTFNGIEKSLTEFMDNYCGYQIAAIQARMRREFRVEKAEFVIDYIAPLFVSYLDWVIRDAIEKGFEKLYFVARDGHPLKMVADALIEANGWSIKTKYIYASRRVWRIPSYINEIDVDFWANYGGNFNDIHSKQAFLNAAAITDENLFHEFFPQIDLDNIDFNDWKEGQPARKLARIMKDNEKYCDYLLNLAREQRELVCGYLKQEVDPKEKHAFVEFWGRGYNQTCHSRLWNQVLGDEVPMYYYYARTNQFSDKNCIRYNMTTVNIDFFYLETIFANMPYRSLEEYIYKDGRIEPKIVYTNYVKDLYEAMELLLPEYARRYAALELKDPSWTDRRVFDFLLNYYDKNKTTAFIYENFGSLEDAVSIYGEKKEFARPYIKEDLENFKKGVPRGAGTMSITMSYARSSSEIQQAYNELYQIEKGDNVAGSRLLKTKELKDNKAYKKKYNLLNDQAAVFNSIYNATLQELKIVERKVLILENSTSLSNVGLCRLESALLKQGIWQTEIVLLKNEIIYEELAKKMASARWIIMGEPVGLLSKTVFRPETEVLLLPAPFKLYNYGQMLSYPLKWRNRYEQLVQKNNFTKMAVPSLERTQSYKDSYLRKIGEDSIIYGNCDTDVYFDEEYRREARGKLRECVPNANGKKIILYMPTLRAQPNCKSWANILDLEKLYMLLGEEYIILLHFNKKQRENYYRNLCEFPPNCVEISKEMKLRELIVLADIIVGDYRDTFFESALLHKPVYFTATDYENVMKNHNASVNANDFSSFIFGPLIGSSEELVDEIRHIDQYDYQDMELFSQRMFGACDGHSVEKIMKVMEIHKTD